jgi:hypothetical protein
VPGQEHHVVVGEADEAEGIWLVHEFLCREKVWMPDEASMIPGARS